MQNQYNTTSVKSEYDLDFKLAAFSIVEDIKEEEAANMKAFAWANSQEGSKILLSAEERINSGNFVNFENFLTKYNLSSKDL